MSCNGCEIEICNVFVCDEKAEITIPGVATIAGEYTFVLKYQNVAKIYKKIFGVGEALIIDFDCLNENYCYSGYILDPNNQNFPIFADQVYSGFKFCTQPLHICS